VVLVADGSDLKKTERKLNGCRVVKNGMQGGGASIGTFAEQKQGETHCAGRLAAGLELSKSRCSGSALDNGLGCSVGGGYGDESGERKGEVHCCRSWSVRRFGRTR
jgi:hypothetical protein